MTGQPARSAPAGLSAAQPVQPPCEQQVLPSGGLLVGPGYSADGSLASSHSHTMNSSRPASVIAYTVRSGRRPSLFTSTGSTKPRSASRATVSYTDDSLMRSRTPDA
jgi:hypothetical protein